MYVYAIECERGKYFIEAADYVAVSVRNHVNGYSSPWTEKYKPLRVSSLWENKDPIKLVYEFMHKYGYQNVRGYNYRGIDLSLEELEEIEQGVKSVWNRKGNRSWIVGEDNYIRDISHFDK